MNTQTYSLNLRVGAGLIPKVKLSQGDVGRELVFLLYDGAVRHTPPSGATVKIKGTKPSGLGFDLPCTLYGSVARVSTTLAMTQESGKFLAELEISSGNNVIGTANFVIYAEPSPHPAGTTDGTTEEARTVLGQCEYYAGVAQDAAEAASGDYTQLSAEIGTLSELTTTAKSSAVAAINEVNSGLSDVKADLEDLDERIDGLGDGVPTTVRQAIKTLFETGGYADISLTDEMAVISSWASQVTAITLNQTSISISGSSTSQLVATTTPAGGTVTWASSDTSVATVSSSGLVTGVGNGSCTITASCGGKNATCTATVSGFATLTSISAVYTQSGTVYNTDTLDSLKDDLVVTAHYDDTTTATVPSADYTLSGILEVGTSTIVVSYGGKTTTFNVTVTNYESPVMSATQGNITSGSTDADKVTVVLNKLTFAPSEVKTISVENGYQIFAFTQYGVNDVSNAGTPYASNKMNVYSIGSNGYVQKGSEANSRISISSTTTWETSKTYTNSNSSITQEVTGIGIYIKTTDGSALTPEQAVNVFSIS